ncbi:hypothetical protein [Catellatospora vulcania]|uniref:hypothetical protein n=1 Tax=Catellatospora vulcania TaxID=1460450 RepID=UPI0012D4A5FE|nr:hypothetical protein [Catellatospora vulcania]
MHRTIARSRSTALVLALALAAAGLTSGTAQAVSWDNVTPHIDSKSVTGLQQLAWSPIAADRLAAVDTAYANGALTATGGPGLSQVYGDTNQQMYYKSHANCAQAKSVITAADAAYTLAAWCFAGSDETSDAWLPQAVTSSQDAAQRAGYTPGDDQVVALWRQAAATGNRARCPGVADDPEASVGLRATFLKRPYTDGTHSEYRHVMLAVPGAPNASGLTYTPVCNVHGGGVTWYGPYLFVSLTGSGILVFDTRKTYRVPADNACGANGAAPGVNDVGQVTGSDGVTRLCAGGYRYVMFQVGSFRSTPTGNCLRTPATIYANLCFSSLSLQWSDNTLVTSEYRTSSEMTDAPVDARIVNWPTDTMIDRMTSGSTAPVTATRLAATNFQGMQGVVEWPNATSGRPEYFVARTLPGSEGSQLWYEHDGDGDCPTPGVYVENAEAISYWVSSAGDGHLWTITEYKNRRMLVRVYTKEYNGKPSGCPTQ